MKEMKSPQKQPKSRIDNAKNTGTPTKSQEISQNKNR